MSSVVEFSIFVGVTVYFPLSEKCGSEYSITIKNYILQYEFYRSENYIEKKNVTSILIKIKKFIITCQRENVHKL